ncbi:MAG: uracil-DNA glycosylase [Rhodoferax sp.]|nr:uracil-DNA glycosylase [Rhodoferax sp.]
MSLDLDSRQRAMLQEMGVHVWWPEAVPQSATAPPVPITPTAPMTPCTSLEVKPGTATAPTADIVTMDWSALNQAVAQCQACGQCQGRRAAVFGGNAASRQADWLVLGEPPDDNEERLGAPFVGQAGQLLDNMLKAVGVQRSGVDGRAAYLSNVVKCRPAIARNPQPQDLAACENYLRREVALVQPKVILALGRFAAQALLQGSVPDVATIPLGKLRGQVYRYQGIAVIVSYPPAYLLRTPQDKARAWADWCLALSVLS